MFWWGFNFIFIPFFGETGSYDGIPGAYSSAGLSAKEAPNAIGLYFWIWFGIALILTIASVRSSLVMVLLLLMMDITLALLASFHYTGHSTLETASGAFGVITALVAYYFGLASFLTERNELL